MIVGFTGTRNGMSDSQAYFFQHLLYTLKPIKFHHGDCVGADSNAHWLVTRFDSSIKIIGHPPILDMYRGYNTCDELRKEKKYLDRNYDIVDESHVLIACPKGSAEELRSGTWATIRYADKKGKEIYLISDSGIWRWKNGRRKLIRQSEGIAEES
jgi:hypothetical protein